MVGQRRNCVMYLINVIVLSVLYLIKSLINSSTFSNAIVGIGGSLFEDNYEGLR